MAPSLLSSSSLYSHTPQKVEFRSLVCDIHLLVGHYAYFADILSSSESINDYHLLVGSAIELGAVFLYVTGALVLPRTHLELSLFCRNVLENGFNRSLFLPQSHLHDSVLCAEVADVNWDGRNELILGTYGKVGLVKVR